MKTLYIHIGTPKTGNFAIQALCLNNSAILEKKSCCFPIFPYHYPDYSIGQNAAFLHKMVYDENGIRKPDEEKLRLQEGFKTVVQLFQKYDNVILSDEYIWKTYHKRRKTMWKELQELGREAGFTVKVIIYLRRQDTFMESWWNHCIQESSSFSMVYDDYFNNIKTDLQLNYYTALELISTELGKENIIVRNYDQKQFPKGLIEADFLNVIGLELTDEYQLSDTNENLRLAGNTHEIKRILNTLPDITNTENNFLRNSLRDLSGLSETNYPSSMISSQEAEDFVARYLEGNRMVAAEYMEEAVSNLFDMTFTDSPKWKKDNPYMIDDVIRFAGQTNIYLLEKLNQLTAENKELQNNLELLKDKAKCLRHKLKHPFRTVFHTGSLK